MRKRPRSVTREERALWNSVASTTTPRQEQHDLWAESWPDPAAPPAAAAPTVPPAPRPAVGDLAPGHPALPERRARPGPPAAPLVTHDLAPPLHEALARAPLRMDRKTHARLRGGRIEPEARIDLHGMTLARAHGALSGFILRARSQGLRLVLVITGKGRGGDDAGPIPERRGLLREQVPHWLAQPPLSGAVLQVVPAHQRHGGGGAYYVYLRRAGR